MSEAISVVSDTKEANAEDECPSSGSILNICHPLVFRIPEWFIYV